MNNKWRQKTDYVKNERSKLKITGIEENDSTKTLKIGLEN